jgi:hypothetical protein
MMKNNGVVTHDGLLTRPKGKCSCYQLQTVCSPSQSGCYHLHRGRYKKFEISSNASIRATRLAEFSPIGTTAYFGQFFFQITEEA